jgi:hypothetical protein
MAPSNMIGPWRAAVRMRIGRFSALSNRSKNGNDVSSRRPTPCASLRLGIASSIGQQAKEAQTQPIHLKIHSIAP